MEVSTESAVAWFVLILVSIAVGQSSPQKQEQNLPSSKTLQLPVPGAPQRTNSFPTAVALSPDGKYLAILNNGRGTAQSKFQQSIALLDLGSNQLRDFPDARLGVDAKQTYFLGLAWSSDGSELYASMASLTDPEGKNPGDTGNGIAVYQMRDGALSPERFLKLPLAPLGSGQHFGYHAKGIPKGKANPYPAGLAVVKGSDGDRAADRRESCGRCCAGGCEEREGSATVSAGTWPPCSQQFSLWGSGDAGRRACLVFALEWVGSSRAGFARRKGGTNDFAAAAEAEYRALIARDGDVVESG